MNTDSEIVKTLIAVARRKSSMDDFDPADGEVPDYYCGNFDDCYNMGFEDGQILAARSLLTNLGIIFKEEKKV